MNKKCLTCNTGLPGLDEILEGVRLGDNVVFKVDNLDDYVRFVHPYACAANTEKKELIYFRFAEHPSVLPEGTIAHIYELHPEDGFESFISEILDVIERFGKGAFYVFDCLSELAVDWYSDRMLGNFFMITCPYLYDFDTVAYFALLRNSHTNLATDAIHNTAQIVLDIYRNKNAYYVHPLKVEERYSPTMYMLHRWEGNIFSPVTRSITTSEILASVPQPWLDLSLQQRDVWNRNFLQAQEVMNSARSDSQAAWKNSKLFLKLLRMVISRDQQLLDLAKKYFDFADLVKIGKRMIGTGLIGGKSVGMLLSRAIINKEDKEGAEKLEPHDSFFIGADIFYTYLIQNKCWWMRRKLKDSDDGFDSAEEVRELMFKGEFPDDIKGQFVEMLQYFGQSPIIVRSSSLLEDAYGNSFSGKYESVFCTNQGTPDERLENFISAVRTVYASTMSKEALLYRDHWDLLDRDERMAILVQRVSGAVYEDYYFPQIAGVGFSFNPFVWNSEIDPKAGMLRLVFGLGTRAVDRIEDDYTRIVALNAPMRRPEATSDDIRKYAQHKIDVLDLKSNSLVTRDFEDVVQESSELPLEIFASRDEELLRQYRAVDKKKRIFSWVLTFNSLLSKGSFVEDMSKMVTVLQKAYNHPVDIEFSANFLDSENYRINLLQCRPFQVKGNVLSVEDPGDIPREQIIMETKGPVIGSSRATTIDRIIYVVPEVYGKMKRRDRYSVARLIGQLTHLKTGNKIPTMMLVGPGRWATSSPELGVPVSFAEINTVSVLCEVAAMHENLIPEISLGTHFFNDLVEMDMLYLALYPQRYDNILNEEFISSKHNKLVELLPDAKSYESAVRVLDSTDCQDNNAIYLNADVLKQNAICYFEKK